MDRKDVDASKTGVIGHSEGAMIAFILAAEYDHISFIISLAGPGVDGKTILLEQSDYINSLSGVDEYVLEDNRNVMSKIYDLIISNESRETWERQTLEFTSAYYSGNRKGTYSEAEIEQAKQNILQSIPESAYAWMRYFIKFDPSSCLGSIN